jgi:hypothetical protein
MRRAAKTDATAIRDALRENTIADAAKILGLSRATLCRRMQEFGVSARDADHMVGERFGLWVVVSVLRPKGRLMAECMCDCGTERTVTAHSLRSGVSQSCGCRNAGDANGNYKHGMAGAPEYNCWQAMKARCHNSEASNYAWYGALGVSVCDRWRESFSAFMDDMGPKPSVGHTVDRIDPFGGYFPGNCRWETRKEQMQNLRRHHAQGQ